MKDIRDNSEPAPRGFKTFSRHCEELSGITTRAGRGGESAEPLAELDYKKELTIKNEAFLNFCQTNRLKTPDIIIASPMARGYRTTTKRRVQEVRGKVKLLSDILSDLTRSLLEPTGHCAIYDFIELELDSPSNRFLRPKINYIIIRGNYEEFSIIFNLNAMNAQIVRAVERMANAAKEACASVQSAFIFFDPTKSKFYFESSYPEIGGLKLKKIFGHKTLRVIAQGIEYHYSPISFSQVNLSAAELMLAESKKVFSDVAGGRFIDLYCGYGFFSCYTGKRFKEVIGLDYAKDSIDSAVDNAKHIESFPPFHFYSRKIDRRSLDQTLPPVSGKEYVLLDPPRKGTGDGVIGYLAHRKIERALHIFCGVDEIPREVAVWRRYGYRVERIIPVDMFPGTFSLEVMVQLEKAD